ncbi:MAG TPA: tripartite tricarboxylate transporter substrate binding protein [Burkholderiales bacterium]|nr:tripartite tricarboxylate transporter substrate binding protein [Burkholderiales bacterium]
MQRLLAALAALVLVSSAAAQSYPDKPVRFVVGLAPGGATDIMARTLAPALGEELGQPAVIDNRPGAAGSIGAALVAKAPPDGYTLFIASSSFTANAVLQQNQSFDPLRDFEPITNIAWAPFLLVARPALPASNVRELIALAKAQPGKLNFASSGVGSTAHLSGEYLKRAAGIDMTHVTYRGAGPALADVLGGQVDVMFSSIVSALPHAKSGRLKVLAITSAKRSSVLPQYPTVAESGVPGFEMVGYFGVLAPAHTPAAAVNRVQAAIARAVRRKDVVERIAADGAEPDGCTPAELRALLEHEIAKTAELVRSAGIKPQ